MTAEYKGRGDPRRSLDLLWRERRGATRGPKPGLVIDQIISTAIAIADTDGLPAVTMRRVAEQLQVGAMSLYTYVPGKAELLDIMLDQVYGESPAQATETSGWRPGLEAHARASWELFQRHPWVLQISDTRALLGPNELDRFESSLKAISDIGLSGREMLSVVSLVTSYVRGAAQVAVDAARAAQQTGVTDEQWWAARAPVFDAYFIPARYPTISGVDLDGSFEPSEVQEEYHLQLAIEAFEFGLQRILDGIEMFLHRRDDRSAL